MRCLRWYLVVVAAIVAVTSTAIAEDKKGSVLATLRPQHPRLILTDERLAELKEQAAGDPVLQRYVQDVISRADDYMDAPQLKHKLIGPRLLFVSRECLNRVYALGLAYRWTGKGKYAEKVKNNLFAVCAFKDWNPAHFLDTAEMSHAVGVGYDWIYSWLDEDSRAKIRAGLVRNGLEPGVAAYGGTGEPHRGGSAADWWVTCEHNWNIVCNGGLIAGAIAVAESEPNRAELIVSQAIRSLPRALKEYGPDGAWKEGPGYWHYATMYAAYGLAALQTGLERDLGLSNIDGLSEAGMFVLHTAGPTGLYFNYADASERAGRGPMPCMFWLGRRYARQVYLDSEHRQLEGRNAQPGHIIWYEPASGKKPVPDELDAYFRGPVEVATFRSGWNDEDALFVAIKAGFNQVNHGHLDLGNFVMDALGVRWAMDLGRDDYNLPGYWDRAAGGSRWQYYRMNSRSHNVTLVAGEGQSPGSKSQFLKFESAATGGGIAVVNLTGAYAEHANRLWRGVRVLGGRRAVLVQDEFELKDSTDILWAMTTRADIEVASARRAILTMRGKKLIAQILSPSAAEFTVESAEQDKPEESNKGVSRLLARVEGANGDVRIAVLLSPVWPDGRVVEQVDIEPLRQW